MRPSQIARRLGKDKAWVCRAIKKVQRDSATAYCAADESEIVREHLAQLESLSVKAFRLANRSKDSKQQLAAIRTAADVIRQRGEYQMAVGYVQRRDVKGQAQSSKRAEEMARTGAVKKILVHEVSRLARRNSIVHKFVENLEDCGVSLYWHAQGIETLLANGKRNPAAGIMLALLAEMARSEVELLRERINSGLAEARRKGVRLGRPTGSKIPTAAFLKTHADIVRQLRAGQSVRNAAKITGKGASTVQRVKLALG